MVAQLVVFGASVVTQGWITCFSAGGTVLRAGLDGLPAARMALTSLLQLARYNKDLGLKH